MRACIQTVERRAAGYRLADCAACETEVARVSGPDIAAKNNRMSTTPNAAPIVRHIKHLWGEPQQEAATVIPARSRRIRCKNANVFAATDGSAAAITNPGVRAV
jgi:hypothetical protein